MFHYSEVSVTGSGLVRWCMVCVPPDLLLGSHTVTECTPVSGFVLSRTML